MMKHIEHLSGLSHRAEQGIVAALPLLLFVEAERCALGRTAGADHRTVKVQCKASQFKRLHTIRKMT